MDKAADAKMLPIGELCEIFHKRSERIISWIRSGKLTGYKLSGRYYVYEDDLALFIANQKVVPDKMVRTTPLEGQEEFAFQPEAV